MQNGEPALATLVAAEPTADLAILRLPERAADAAFVRGDRPVKPGEAVVVVGFPLARPAELASERYRRDSQQAGGPA